MFDLGGTRCIDDIRLELISKLGASNFFRAPVYLFKLGEATILGRFREGWSVQRQRLATFLSYMKRTAFIKMKS